MTELQRKLNETIRSCKCQKKGCLSANQDNLEVVWFGARFEHKEATCSSCVLRSDDVLSRLEPVALNLMPVSAFTKKFAEQSAEYFKLKTSKDWLPKLTEQRRKDLLAKLDAFEKRLMDTLNQLVEVLKEFGKRVADRSKVIFTIPEFEQILKMENDNNFGKLLVQIELLIKQICRTGDKTYRFYSEADRNAKNAKLKLTIADVANRVNATLAALLTNLNEKMDEIKKV